MGGIRKVRLRPITAHGMRTDSLGNHLGFPRSKRARESALEDVRSHDAPIGVALRGEYQVAEFVGNHVSQQVRRRRMKRGGGSSDRIGVCVGTRCGLIGVAQCSVHGAGRR